MAATFKQYAGDGAVRNFSLPFPYLDRSHVKVAVGGVPQDSFTFLTDSMIQLTVAPPAGTVVFVFRKTPPGWLPVDFQDGSILAGADLNSIATYSAYLAEEAADSITSAVLFDLSGVFESWSSGLSGASGASTIGYQAPGTGGLLRTAESRLRETVSLADYSSLQYAVDAAVARGIGMVTLSGEALTVPDPVDMKGVGLRGQGTVINNTSNLSNVGPIRDCIVRGFPSDVDYISPLSFGGLHKKVVFGDSATVMSVLIKRRGRGYVKCEHWYNNFGSGAMDTAVACENWRGTVARYMSEVYLYRHTAAATEGTWAASGNMLVSVSFPTGTAAGGRAVKFRAGTSAGATIDYTVNTRTLGQRGVAAIYCTSGSTPSADLLVNGVVQRNFSCVRATTGVDILLVEYTCTQIGANTIRLRNNTAGSQTLGVIGVEFSTLENYTTGDVDAVAFGDYAEDYLPSNGANDYAFLSTATGKFFGSVHGGETQRVAPELLLDGVNVGIPAAGSFFVGENLQLRQRTTMADGAGGSLNVESTYTYYEDSAQKLDVFMSGSARVTTAYTAMSTTSDRFTLVSFPQFAALSAPGTYLFGRHNVISQLNRADPSIPCKLTTAFTLHPMGGDTGANMGANGVYILAGTTFKVYYAPVVNSPTTITKLSFNTTRLFE